MTNANGDPQVLTMATAKRVMAEEGAVASKAFLDEVNRRLARMLRAYAKRDKYMGRIKCDSFLQPIKF